MGSVVDEPGHGPSQAIKVILVLVSSLCRSDVCLHNLGEAAEPSTTNPGPIGLGLLTSLTRL